jgi:quercetin dioxygenase-like cupin family protein
MKIIQLSEVPKARVEMEGVVGAHRQVPIGKADGSPTFSLRVFTVEPGGNTPHHAHPFEHVNYVLEGDGELLSPEGPRKIRRGDYILVLPGEKHQYRNTSATPLVFMCVVPKEYE